MTHPWFAMIEASLEAARQTLDAMGRMAIVPAEPPAPIVDERWRWTTRNMVVAETSTMRVRIFGNPAVREDRPTGIVVAPYALHAAKTADFAHGHSVVAALLQAGFARVVLTDWRSATPSMGHLSIDSYLAELNVLVDDVGAPATLVGLCQGGLLAAIYAARFPKKVARLALAGAPLDLEAEASVLSGLIAQTPRAAIEALIAQGGGVLRADLVMAMWPTTAARDSDVTQALQLARPPAALTRRFIAWNSDLVDLPGTFYRETVDRIFRDNAFARAAFPALGRMVGLRDLRCPLFLLAAGQDEIVSPPQVLAAAAAVATPQRDIVSRVVEGRHLSLYMGRVVLAEAWPQVAAFLLGRGQPAPERVSSAKRRAETLSDFGAGDSGMRDAFASNPAGKAGVPGCERSVP
jgi:poly(3-hydroxyalkanoate) synthetase